MADIRKRRKAHVAKEQCVACGCCVRRCPVGAIEVVRGLFARVNQDKCVGCGRCAGECILPDGNHDPADLQGKGPFSGGIGLKKRALPALALLLLMLTGCTAPAPEAGAYRQVTMTEAVEMMEKETDYIILDVRTESEFASGHIPGAMLLPNETIGTEEIPQLSQKDQLILVYCRSGNRSKQAADKLARLGYTNIVEFGGINSWPGDIVTE